MKGIKYILPIIVCLFLVYGTAYLTLSLFSDKQEKTYEYKYPLKKLSKKWMMQ